MPLGSEKRARAPAPARSAVTSSTARPCLSAMLAGFMGRKGRASWVDGDRGAVRKALLAPDDDPLAGAQLGEDLGLAAGGDPDVDLAPVRPSLGVHREEETVGALAHDGAGGDQEHAAVLLREDLDLDRRACRQAGRIRE